MILDVTFDVTALARKPRASGDDPYFIRPRRVNDV